MALPSKPKRGRPRMREQSVWFGMKMSLDERNAIKRRARSRGTTMSGYLRDLIDRDVPLKPKKTERRLTGQELMALPAVEAARRLEAAAKLAAPDYEEGGALRIFEADDSFIEY